MNGCVTVGGHIQSSYSHVSQIKEADTFFDKGQYQTALLKYSGYVLSPFPDKKHEDYATYKLALCYFLLGQYHEAGKTANQLISTFPDFEYIDQARDLLARSKQKIDEKDRLLAENWSDLQQQISKQEALVSQNPRSAQDQFQLGDLYWKAGRFEDAVHRYEIAARLDRSILEKKSLRDRVRITQQGEFRLRDPLYQNIEKPSPIQVVQVRRERLVREDFIGQYEGLRLSGFVVNKGLYDVQNVKIEIAVYDFFDTVQETKLIHIGELRAGGRRPFTAIFTEYQGLAIDITKYTTEVFYDEPVPFGNNNS